MLAVEPGYAGFVAFAAAIGEPLEPFERRLARAHFGAQREVVVVLPRGNKKTTFAAKLGLHHLLTVPSAGVTLGAASVAQANIAFERMKGFGRHAALDGALVIRHRELRYQAEGEASPRLIRIVPADGSKAHGLSSTLYVGDEVWMWPGEALLEAFASGLVKNPSARFLGISTSAGALDTPLGRMRARALAGKVSARKAGVFEAVAPGLRWLEWSLPDDADLGDIPAVKAVNPARYITAAALREQHQRLSVQAFAQFHACRWGTGGEDSWLAPGAWQSCVGAPEFELGEDIWLGVDVGGERSASAVVWVSAPRVEGSTAGRRDVGAGIFEGDGGLLDCIDLVRRLAAEYRVREVAYDPWRFSQAAQELAQARVKVVEFPQTDQRMAPASTGLHEAIVQRRLVLPSDATFAAHSANTIARHSRRGWRIDKADGRSNNDAVVALAMALERASVPARTLSVVGWL
jgi:phage terminase large subunit-like protein